jgi:hypothetical protein
MSDPQRLMLLEWIAEGCDNKEINERGAKFEEPFSVSSQLNYAYRKQYAQTLEELRTERDLAALHTGLALRANRVKKLFRLAEALENDLYERSLVWTKNVKGIGSGDDFERIEFKEFNAAEIKELRGVYDDIAKETGGRVARADITSGNQKIKGYMVVSPDEWPDAPSEK